MTDKRIKSYLEDRLEKLENIKKEREWTTSELGDITCCKQTLAFIDSLQEEPAGLDKGKLMGMLEDSLSKETKESWNERLGKDEEPVSEDLEKVVEEIVDPTVLNAYGVKELARRLRNTICGTSVSEDLEEASKEWLRQQLDKSYANYGEAKMMELTHFDGYAMLDAIEFGAEWQKEKLWKPADGDDLPEIDREVIVFTQPYPLEGNEYVVSFAHRPNPDGWDGKSLATGKIEHYTPKTYGEGGWNIPDVKYWLDIIFPNK